MWSHANVDYICKHPHHEVSSWRRGEEKLMDCYRVRLIWLLWNTNVTTYHCSIVEHDDHHYLFLNFFHLLSLFGIILKGVDERRRDEECVGGEGDWLFPSLIDSVSTAQWWKEQCAPNTFLLYSTVEAHLLPSWLSSLLLLLLPFLWYHSLCFESIVTIPLGWCIYQPHHWR